MERLSIQETKNIADLYQLILNEDMSVGGLLGGVPSHGGDLVNHDDYAQGDTRKPYLFGKGDIQSRKGLVKRKRNKKRRKSKKSA